MAAVATLDPISPFPSSLSSYSASSSSPSSSTATSTPPPVRYSRLPFLVAQCVAGPSTPGPQRHLFFAVRRGRFPGVYTDWREAERQVLEFADPLCKTFSTKLAAEAFVRGWDGAGRHSLPPSSPQPLREYLALEFGASSLLPSSRSKSYHTRLLATDLDFPSTVAPGIAASSSTMSKIAPPVTSVGMGMGMGVGAAAPGASEFGMVATAPTRPPLRPHSSSYRNSMVRISSPLRQEVDDAEDDGKKRESSRPPASRRSSLSQSHLPPTALQPQAQALASLLAGSSSAQTGKGRPNSFLGLGGLITPPQSPESMMDRQRPLKSRAASESGPWASTTHRDFTGLGVLSPPNSPPASASDKPTAPPSTWERRKSFFRSPSSSSSLASTTSGLWADSHAPAPARKQSAPPSLSSASSSSLSSVSSASAPWKRLSTAPTDFNPAATDEIPPELQLPAGKAAPKFSRSAMKKTGIVMPVSAPKPAAPPSLKSRLSQTSLSSLTKSASNSSSLAPSSLSLSRSPSATSLSSIASSSVPNVKQSSKLVPRSLRSRGADRLASLAETSKAEVHLDEDSLELSLAPPRPAFMRRTPSNSSLSSTASSQSIASYTSSSSVPFSVVDTITEEAAAAAPEVPSKHELPFASGRVESMIQEEEDVEEDNVSDESQRISCTRSDGDADGEGSVETVSTSSASTHAAPVVTTSANVIALAAQKKKSGSGGGMFKRFSKALKLEKKGTNERRPSL